jgi:RHS repeat-associated protein
LTRISYSGRALCKLTRDTFGQEIQRISGEVSSKFEYDPMGRLLRQRAVKQEIPLIDRSYRYDKTGNLRQIDDLNDGKMKLHYDALDRLQQVEGRAEEQFTFDPAGNLLDSQYPEPQGYVQGNRLRVFHNYRFEYDDVGNLVRQFQGKLETRFYYNVANQLVRVHKSNQIYEYSYDPLGRRVSKKDALGETTFIWDGDCLLLEQRDNNDVVYIHESGRSHPLLQIRDDEVYYFHTDQSGTPHIITNTSGDTVWKASYDVYGAVTQTDMGTLENPIRYLGLYYDSETGLLYGQQRYYHPAIGRYTQQNPLGLEGGTNNYLLNSDTLPPIALPIELIRRLFKAGLRVANDHTVNMQRIGRKNTSLFGSFFARDLAQPVQVIALPPLPSPSHQGIFMAEISYSDVKGGAHRNKY